MDFVQHYHKNSFLDALTQVANHVGMEVPEQILSPSSGKKTTEQTSLFSVMEKACQWFQQCLLSADGNEARGYLQERCVPEKTWHDFRVGWWPQEKTFRAWATSSGLSDAVLHKVGILSPQGHPHMRERIIFPIMDHQKKIRGFGGRIVKDGHPKYINSPETELFQKSQCLYGSQFFSQHREKAVVVEGYLDVMAVHPHLPALSPLGTAMSEDQLAMVWKKVQHPIICFDGDAAGRKAALRLAQKALTCLRPGHHLSFCFLPHGMDPQSCITKEGWNFFHEKLQDAKPLAHFLWDVLFLPREGAPRLPEEHAEYIGQWREWVASIPHKDVQRAYNDFFYEKRTKVFARTKKHKIFVDSGSPPPPPSMYFYEKILLGMLLWYPSMIISVQEELGRWIESPQERSVIEKPMKVTSFWEGLRQHLISWAESYPEEYIALPTREASSEDSDPITHHLHLFLQKALGEEWRSSVGDISTFIPLSLHPSAAPHQEELLLYWREIYNQYCRIMHIRHHGKEYVEASPSASVAMPSSFLLKNLSHYS